ncbi:MAG TPA: polysaccharide biosynthesis/export family protein [Mesorhizobium sp.]|nr:polysaccharide biosynthesis/export family protein [Mesorhizobium sp.]
MDHMPEWKAASNRPALHCEGQRPSTIAALFPGIPKWSRSVTLSLIAFCLITLLGSSATGQSQANGRLAPQDTIELHVSGWNALIGRFMEAMLVNNTFTIDSSGALDLPMIGQLPAAGLREDELAKLITDRLQVMSGLHERAVTSVQRMPQGERTKAAVLQRGPPPAPIELETAERRAATPTQALGGAHNLEAAHARALQETSAVSQGEQAAEVANKQREMVTRERGRGVVLEQKLLAARGEIDALKGSAQTAIAEREEARRALATVPTGTRCDARHSTRRQRAGTCSCRPDG